MLTSGLSGSEAFHAQPETASVGCNATASEERAIRAAMASYNDALNNGSTDAALALYARDGVFMPPYSPSAIGKEAVSPGTFTSTYDPLIALDLAEVNSFSRTHNASMNRINLGCSPQLLAPVGALFVLGVGLSLRRACREGILARTEWLLLVWFLVMLCQRC